MTFPVITGDTLPAFLGAQPGSHALVREYDTRGNGGGFCSIRSLSSACRRRVAPLMVQIPPRLVAVRSQFGAVRRPNRRPPR